MIKCSAFIGCGPYKTLVEKKQSVYTKLFFAVVTTTVAIALVCAFKATILGISGGGLLGLAAVAFIVMLAITARTPLKKKKIDPVPPPPKNDFVIDEANVRCLLGGENREKAEQLEKSLPEKLRPLLEQMKQEYQKLREKPKEDELEYQRLVAAKETADVELERLEESNAPYAQITAAREKAWAAKVALEACPYLTERSKMGQAKERENLEKHKADIENRFVQEQVEKWKKAISMN